MAAGTHNLERRTKRERFFTESAENTLDRRQAQAERRQGRRDARRAEARQRAITTDLEDLDF